MPSITNSVTRVQFAEKETHAAPSLCNRRRQFLLATVLTTGLFTTLGLGTDRAIAANECGTIPVTVGNYNVACGQTNGGPNYVSIVYGNGQTSNATTTTFTFGSTQADGAGGTAGAFDRNAVSLSSNGAGRSITVQVLDNGLDPRFAATTAQGGFFIVPIPEPTSTSGFVVQTSGATSGIVFNVQNGSFLGAGQSGVGVSLEANGAQVTTTGATSGITGTFGGIFTGGSSLLGSANGLLMSTTNIDSAVNVTTTHGTYTGGTGTLGSANGLVISTGGNNSGITHAVTAGTFAGGTGLVGNANGLALSTSGATSAISQTITAGTFTGGIAGTGSANGLSLSTSGATSAITHAITAGTFTGGTAAAGNASGMSLSTTGITSAISETITAGTFTGGLAVLGNANGAALTTTGATSGITFNLATGSFTGGTVTNPGADRNASGLLLSTTGLTSAITSNITTGGTFAGGNALRGAADGFAQHTTGGSSGITSIIAGGTFTGGNTGLGTSHGLNLTTTGNTSAISLTMNGGSTTGGIALIGSASGLNMSTTGNDSGVTANLVGSYAGGTATLNAQGVEISTAGTDSSVIFGLTGNGSTITAGTSLLASDGVRVNTATANSNITFEQGVGTTISSNSGNGVSLHANGGGSIIAGNTINGTINVTTQILGVGVGTGFVGTAVGAGTTDIHVGTTGIVNGSGSGVIGTAVDGNVTLLNEGQVNQTSTTATNLNPLYLPSLTYGLPFAYVPVGMGGAATGLGSVDITTTLGSSVTQAGAQAITGIEGVGISAQTFLGSGNATITSGGTVAATGIGLWSNANSGTAVATSNNSVTLVGGAGGPALYIDPYLIQSFSTVGILSQSVTNSATANLIALNGNPASVSGFDIGVAANVFAGSANATVNVDGTNGGATVNANNTGLYAAVSILGTGNAIINQTNGSTTAAVAAAAVALNPASNATINNTQNSVLNGAVIAAAGLDATVNNSVNSQINIPSFSAIVVGAGRDATINNNTGSDITLAGPFSVNFMVAGLAGNGGNATINNVNGGTTFTVNGPLSANLMFATTDTTINNYNGAQFNLNGPLTANAMVAGQDAIIRNYNGGDFTIGGIADANVMVAGRDAIIENYNGGTFNMLGAFNANMMFADRDAIIRNYNGGDFNVVGAINLNYMNAERDARIENYNGGSFNLLGAINGNVMVADRDATITNYNGGDFRVVGLLSGNLMVAGQDARITNYNGGTFSLLGGGNGNLMTAGRDATIDNSTGGQVNLVGLNGSLMVAGLAGNGGNAIVNNYDGGTFNFLGGNIVSLVAPNAAIFNNNAYSAVNMRGLNAITINGGDESTFNNTANYGGNNRQTCEGNLIGVCVTGVGIISGGAIGQTLNFNNNGGLVSMINQSSSTVTDAAAFLTGQNLAYPQYNTGVGDITVIGGNFNATNKSQLGVDAFLAGPNNSSSDLMIVTGRTNGKTGIVVNDLNSGPGQFNPQGIPVVAVVSGNTNKSDFFIDPTSSHYDSRFGGIIDKGLFFYSHQVRKDPFFNGGVDHVLVSAPDQELFEYSKAVTGAQNIWYETTGVWLERQADLRNFLMARGGGMPAGAGADMATPIYKAPPPVPVKGVTPGVWLKGLGSWTDRDSTNTYSVLGQQFNFDTSYKQNVYGVIGGVDGGWDYRDSVFMVGLLGGYIDSNLKFNATSNSIDYSGGTVGAYATYINRGFYVDTIFKADLLKMKWNANTLAAFGGAAPETDANSYGIQADAGYRFQNGAMFWEPLGTIAWLRTSVDQIQVLGQNLAFGDTNSVRGSLGGRVGVANYWSGMKVEASVTGRVWHEFEDPAALNINAGLLTIADQFKGTYGDVNGTLNFIGLQSGWSSFFNGGVKWNSEFTTVSAKGGVRYNW